MTRALDVIWWACVAIGALSLFVDAVWLDGETKAWIALLWLVMAVLLRLERGRA